MDEQRSSTIGEYNQRYLENCYGVGVMLRRRRSASLETATPGADSFLNAGRMGVESSGKIMVRHCFYMYEAK